MRHIGRLFSVALIGALMFNLSHAHGSHVHLHQVKQAYTLLKNEFGSDIPEMRDYIGLNNVGDGGRIWRTGLVTVGAWREDLEDIVYWVGDIDCGWDPASTHFWDADAGDW